MNKFLILAIFTIATSSLFGQNYIIVSQDGLRPTSGLPQEVLNNAVIKTTLTAAHDYIKDHLCSDSVTLIDSTTVYVRGGTYFFESITWNESHPEKPLKIIAYPGEKPVFDGRELINGTPDDNDPRNQFFKLEKPGSTNYTLDGLTIRNYESKAVVFKSNGAHNGNNTVKNCTFERIGTSYASGDNIDFGYSALGFTNSNNNLILNNTFSYLNNKKKISRIHALYFSNSSNDTIQDNFIEMCAGDPIRVRNGSNNNLIENNYIDRSGLNAFVSDKHDSTEAMSQGTTLKDNIFTFPHPNNEVTLKLYRNNVDPELSEQGYTDLGNKVIGYHGDLEEVTAMTTGDVSGDGIDEIFVAFRYREITKIVRSESEKGNHLSKVIYYAPPFYDDWVVSAMVIDDFDDDNTPELVTAFNTDDMTQVHRGDGVSSATNLGKIYESTWWHVVALTSGDFDENNIPEIITGYNAPSQSEIKRGNGVTSLGNYNKLFESTTKKVISITSGNFDGTGSKEILSSFDDQGQAEVYRGDGLTELSGATNFGLVYDHSWWNVDDLSSGNFDSDSKDEVITVYNGTSLTNIKRGNGISSLGNFGKLFEDDDWWIAKKVAVGNIDYSGQPKVITAYHAPTQVEVKIGNGITNSGGIDKIYANYNLGYIPSPWARTMTNQEDEVSTTEKQELIQEIAIHPNPASHYLRLLGVNDTNIKITNILGTVVLEEQFNKEQVNIDVSSFKSGVYIISFEKGTQKFYKRVIIE